MGINDGAKILKSKGNSEDPAGQVRRAAPHTARPFCLDTTDELWARLGHTESVFARRWPEADPAALERDEVTLVVQIDGKVRSRLTVEAGAPEADVQRRALADDKVKTWLAARRVERVVIVPNRLVNIVTHS